MSSSHKIVLVLGANGFIGTHLCNRLEASGHAVLRFDVDNEMTDLATFVARCDFIVHLAGVMRPKSADEFEDVNDGLTTTLNQLLIERKRVVPILFSSSIQAVLDNPYGLSKKRTEEMLYELQRTNGNSVYVYRLCNAFGPNAKPNYNSVFSTFCYNILHDLPIYIRDPNCVVPFIYVGDIVSEFVSVIEGRRTPSTVSPNSVNPVYPLSLGALASVIKEFAPRVIRGEVPEKLGEFERKLILTMSSYI